MAPESLRRNFIAEWFRGPLRITREVPVIFTGEHYHLLPAAVRSREDVEVLAERAEAAVVDAFTEEQAGGLAVKLKGWNDDPALMDKGLHRRLVLTIATVAEHLAAAPTSYVQSASRGERAVTYRSIPTLPRGWSRLLRPYDERTPLHRI